MANGKGKRAAPTPEVIDVGAVEDVQMTSRDGSLISAFVEGVAAFFTTARSLERGAQQTLERARALRVPTSQTEDEAVQRFVKQTTVDKKAVEEHWGICSTAYQFHRRLTAARDRSVKPLEEANNLANRAHNSYAEAERRRAAEEQDRIRRQREEDARRARERELAELEAQAVAREEASADLSEREQMFVSAYVRTGNGQQAAQWAGYKDPLKHAARLITLPKIVAAIKAQTEAQTLRQQAAAKREAPLDVVVEKVTPNIARTGSERTTWSADLLDEVALIEACLNGRHGIPRDILMVNMVKLHEYARSLHERLDLWPGVRAKKTTKVV